MSWTTPTLVEVCIGLAANRSVRLVLETNPAVQACRRMQLSANYLYVHEYAD
ncbi:MAG: hypothetical protein WCD69_17805 [Xanthobacteraceae bacterium]